MAPATAAVSPIRRALSRCNPPTIVYPDGGVAQVAETRYKGDRLIVRRTRLVGAQAELFPNWRYHAFVTDRVDGRGRMAGGAVRGAPHPPAGGGLPDARLAQRGRRRRAGRLAPTQPLRH